MMSSEDENERRSTDWYLDLHEGATKDAFFALRRYLETMERQMPAIQSNEMSILDNAWPDDEHEAESYSQIVTYLDDLFEKELAPMIRYSFIVLTLTVLEFQLRCFCENINPARCNKEKRWNYKGVADYADFIEAAGIPVRSFQEWTDVENFNLIRNCIVHYNGFLEPTHSYHQTILEFVSQHDGIELGSVNLCL